jgi:hypothetical protein
MSLAGEHLEVTAEIVPAAVAGLLVLWMKKKKKQNPRVTGTQ